MDPIDNDPFEESWFFGNLLDKKTKTMSRCYSDPCQSSSSGKSNTCVEFPEKSCNLLRAPSLPASMGRAREGEERKTDSQRRSKCRFEKPPKNLHRVPSLPPCIGREEDAENEYSLSRLIRQASLNSADELPPKHDSKGMKQYSSAPRHRPIKISETENIDKEACNEKRNQNLKVQTKLRKSLSDVKLKEIGVLKDPDFKFDSKYSNPGIISGFQAKAHMGLKENKLRRPYSPEAWIVSESGPSVLNMVDKSSSAEDMKAQIKYWARAVASNVR